VPTVLKSRSLNLLEPSAPAQACNGIALPIRKNSYEDLKSSVLRHHYPTQSVTDVSENFAATSMKVGVHFQLHHQDGGNKLIYNVTWLTIQVASHHRKQ